MDGFTVTPQQSSAALLTVTIDGAALQVKSARSLSFTKTAAGWRQGRYTPLPKQPGAEGPIAEAVTGRHIYVYGTGGAPAPEELASRRKVAETAAGWSTVRQRLDLALAVKADSAVTAEDTDGADLVLFGTAETNSLIARFAARAAAILQFGGGRLRAAVHRARRQTLRPGELGTALVDRRR